MKFTKAKKTPPAEDAATKDYFADIGLGAKEPIVEGPPPKKKKKIGSGRRMIYKYPSAQKLFIACHRHILSKRCTSFCPLATVSRLRAAEDRI